MERASREMSMLVVKGGKGKETKEENYNIKLDDGRSSLKLKLGKTDSTAQLEKKKTLPSPFPLSLFRPPEIKNGAIPFFSFDSA